MRNFGRPPMSVYSEAHRQRRRGKLKYISPRLANLDIWHPEPETAYVLQHIANSKIADWFRNIVGTYSTGCSVDGCRPRLFGCALTYDRKVVTVCPDCYDPKVHFLQDEQWIRMLGEWKK